MRNKKACSLLFITWITLLPISANAKTYAWLINTAQSSAHKVDVGNNTLVRTLFVKEGLRPSVELQGWENTIIADAPSSLLFVIYDYPGRHMGQGIKAYNLIDLAFKKDLGITSKDPRYDLPKLIIPPVGDNLFVIWWDSSKEVTGQGGKTITAYSKATLTKIRDLADFPIDIYRPWMFSSDGTKLYSLNIDTSEIKVYDSRTLVLLTTISFAGIWSTLPLYGRGEEYFVDDRILLAENIRKSESEPNNFNYFTYAILTREVSKKINFTNPGYGVLSNDGTRTLIIEIMASSSGSANRIHIYNSQTGYKLGMLDLNDKYRAVRTLKMATITPDNTKLYLMAERKDTGENVLLIFSMKSPYSIIAEIRNIEGSRLIFFEN